MKALHTQGVRIQNSHIQQSRDKLSGDDDFSIISQRGYVQSSCKKLQARQESCPEIASFRVFGYMISPTVFFVHDFASFYRFKMAC
jgi:hypothetical protein